MMTEWPDSYPDGFREWSQESKVEYISSRYKRGALLNRCLRLADVDVDVEIDHEETVKKSEIAAIYIALREADREP